MNIEQQQIIVGLLKAGQDAAEESDKKKIKKRPSIFLRGSYPDYSKSLVTRHRRSPHEAGVSRGIGTGITGAVLGALIARILSDKPKHMLAGAAAGGVAAGVPGYISGRDEALSDYSKLLFLRRLGMSNLGELSATKEIPGAWRKTLVGDVA